MVRLPFPKATKTTADYINPLFLCPKARFFLRTPQGKAVTGDHAKFLKER